jgi:putative transposase
MFYVQVVNGMLFQEVLELQVQSMIDFKNGGRLMYLEECGLMVYRYMIKKIGIDWKWQATDGTITKAPLGEKSTGANPTDRAKSGTKRSIVVDGKGVPLVISVDAANKHDMKMTKSTLKSIVIQGPEPTARAKQHMCTDRGYDFPEVYELLLDYAYTIYIKLKTRRGTDTKK